MTIQHHVGSVGLDQQVDDMQKYLRALYLLELVAGLVLVPTMVHFMGHTGLAVSLLILGAICAHLNWVDSKW